MYTINSFSQTPKEFIQFVNDNIGKKIKVLFKSGTGSGKTTIISLLPKFTTESRVIFIQLSPSIAITSRIIENQRREKINTYSFNSFRNIKPQENIISIVDTHASINSQSSKIHSDGDTKSVIKLLHEYSSIGYNIVLSIDESGVHVTDENNEIVKIIKKLPENCMELHFSATPDLTLGYDKIFDMPDEEIKKTGRVKNNILVHRLGHSDDYEMINDVLKKREDIEPYYNGNTVTAQFFCETGPQFKKVKESIYEVALKNGYKENEIFDLTVEGKIDNIDDFEKFMKEISSNSKHKYKIIITKYAGAIGLDCPSISVLGLMRNMGKKTENQQIQIIGRGKRVYNGKKVENEIQDNCYVFVKEDFIFPDYINKEISNHEKVDYIIKNNDLLTNVQINVPIINMIEDNEKNGLIDTIIDNFNYKNIINKNHTVTKITKLSGNIDLTGQTLNNNITDDEINYYEPIGWSLSIKIRESYKTVFDDLFEGCFVYFLEKLGINEKIITKNIRENVKIREKLSEIIEIIKKKTKKIQVVGEKNFQFTETFHRHKTNIEKVIDHESVLYDKILYSDSKNTLYFDSEPELRFFDEVTNKKSLKFIFQNPRTNQGGVSFYLPENNINHSPDFIINYNNKIWFIEVTSWNKILEKEKFMKSQAIPKNYMLVVLNSKNKLVTLTKEQYDEKTFQVEDSWTKINECYVNI